MLRHVYREMEFVRSPACQGHRTYIERDGVSLRFTRGHTHKSKKMVTDIHNTKCCKSIHVR